MIPARMSSTGKSIPADELAILGELENKVLWLASWTIHHANHVRENIDGLKVGGHQASSASLASIMIIVEYGNLHRPRLSSRIIAAPLSAIIIVGALVLPEVMVGMGTLFELCQHRGGLFLFLRQAQAHCAKPAFRDPMRYQLNTAEPHDVALLRRTLELLAEIGRERSGRGVRRYGETIDLGQRTKRNIA